MVRFELKIAVTLLLTEEKRKATFDSRLRLSIEEVGGAFENRLWVGILMGKTDSQRLIAHLKSKSTSPIVFQIHFQKPITLSEIARSSWQRTLRGRCNYLIP